MRWLTVLTLFLTLIPTLVFAKGVDLEADQLVYDKEEKAYRASGTVNLKYRDVDLTSDTLIFDNEKMQGEAKGNVIIEREGTILHGEKVSFDLNSDKGEVLEAELFVPEGNFTLFSNRIERLSKKKYRLDHGEFTTCDPDDPAWKFSARSITMNVDGYVYGKHAVFYVQDIPIFYFPYFIYPIVSGRESGFLTPRFGRSELHGTELSLSYYQVLGRNMDATIFLDNLSKTGAGLGAEYRYLFGREQLGSFKGYNISGLDSADDRYALSWKHLGGTGGANSWRMITDLAYVSERDYFSEFGTVAQEYNREVLYSTAAVTYSWQRTLVAAGAEYTRDLDQGNETTLQYLPSLQIRRIRTAVADLPLQWRLSADYQNLWRKEVAEADRLTFEPAITLTQSLPAGFQFETDLTYRQLLYSGSDIPSDQQGAASDLVATLSLPLSRTWQQAGGEGWRHLLEPQFVYRKGVTHDEPDIFFDREDAIFDEDTVAFRLSNRLFRKGVDESGEPQIRELLSLDLTQEYYLDTTERDVIESGEKDLSATMFDWIWRPTERINVDGELIYDLADQDSDSLQQAATRISVSGQHIRSVSAEYRYLLDAVDYLDARMVFDWDRWLLTLKERYTFADDQELEKGFEIAYRKDCWGLSFSYEDRLEDETFFIGVNLSGVGSVGDFGGSFAEEGDE